MDIKLGYLVKDVVTGLKGFATARIEYLNGCIQFHVQPPFDNDGKKTEGIYVDEERLEVIDHGVYERFAHHHRQEPKVGSDPVPVRTGGVMAEAPSSDGCGLRE